MNWINQLYCRAFQSCFRLAIPFLPYRKPQQIARIEDLPHVLDQENCQCVLLVSDPGIVKLGLHQPVVHTLSQNGITVICYDKTQVNPTVSNVEEALALYQQHHCKGLIALGGGSSIDCAKGVGARVVRPHTSLHRMRGVLKVWRRLPVLIAIPTTAGTGSECTLAAVITDPKAQTKYAINDFPLIPKYALLDARMTFSMPPFLTATTGLDALTHAVEAYIGRSTTQDTREAALKAIHLIFAFLPRAHANGQDQKARESMAQAAYLAGLAFTKSYVGYVHALAHALGGVYGSAHGLANAVLLPVVLRGYGSAIHQKLKDCAIAAGLADSNTDPQAAALHFIESIEAMNRCFAIPSSIPEIQPQDLPYLCAHAAKEANPLYPVPVLYNARQLEVFYRAVMKEETQWKAMKSMQLSTNSAQPLPAEPR